MEQELSQFGIVLLFVLGGLLFALTGLTASKILRPHRPNPEKNTTYESGEDPVGNARIQFNIRFYVIALIFLIFEVEILFFFPWATIYADKSLIAIMPGWGWFALVEVLLFAGILLLGLAYAWVKGDLDWVKPEPIVPERITEIPESAYTEFNSRY